MNIEELFAKIGESEELQNELVEVLNKEDKDALTAWVKEQGCDASLSEIKEFMEEKKEEALNSGELTPEELDQAAGGSEVIGSILFAIGLGATAAAAGAAIGAAVGAISSWLSSC